MPKKSEKKSKQPEDIQDVTKIKTEPAIKSKKVAPEAKRSQKYQQAKNQIDKTKFYSISEALELLKKLRQTKFISSVELHLNMIEKGIKQNVALPFGTGRAVRVAVVNDELLAKLDNNLIDFDVLVTEPAFMPRLAKYAKLLGPKGLMPNPKNGTITTDIEKARTAFSKGQIQVKTEANFPLIHQLVGKLDMKNEELAENIEAIVAAVKKAKIKTAFIKTTMSPAIRLDLAKI